MARQLLALLPLCALALLLVAMLDCVTAGDGRISHHPGRSLRHRPHLQLHLQLHHHQRHHQREHRPKRHRRHRVRRVRVRTACHGNKLTLGCHPAYRVHVLSAFYGRATGRICPAVFGHHLRHKKAGGGRCSAKGSLGRVRRLCDGRQRCRLSASARQIGGGQCGARQLRGYLRVRYVCKFHDCRRIVRLQAKLLLLIARYGKLARVSRSYWRRRHYLRRRYRLSRKLNHLRRRFHVCFECRRGCDHIHKFSARLKRAETRIRALLKKISAKRQSRMHRVRWHASRWFLRRKLAYIRARQRMLRHRLRRCMRLCHY